MSSQDPQDQRRLPSAVYNLLTLIGFVVAGLSLSLSLFLFLIEVMADEPNPYMGIVAFVILPVFLFAGVVLIVVGVVRELRARRLHPGAPRRMPRLDLGDARHRLAVVVFSVGTILLVAFGAFGSFQAYDYTDSNEFCGTVCHTPMHPEYTTFGESPHARVKCVECHIGPGAEWFVRSKLSGAYQVYAVLFDKFPRPIPTPIHNLRPARDTCEECHWPEYFYREKLAVRDYYLSDEENTHSQMGLLMHIGGGDPSRGYGSGVHWHMNTEREVYYFPADDRRSEIPWILSRTKDGREKVYVDPDAGFKPEDLAPEEIRRMDCLDCHNRPTHNYRPPGERVNFLLSRHRIDPDMPSAKEIAVDALEEEYASTEQAMHGIAQRIREAYQEKHPEVARTRPGEIETMIEQVQDTYRRNYFPTMNVSWRDFPDNRGHLYSPGCFRCHTGRHRSGDGSVISRDCGICHTLLSNGAGPEAPLSFQAAEFVHPEDIDGEWKEMNCDECHGG